MSAPSQSLAKTEYRLTDVLNLLKKDIMMSLNCHAIGTIQSVDLVNQKCNVQIAYLRTIMQPATGVEGSDVSNTYAPKTIAYPVLSDCPFVSIQGGSFSLTVPVKIGDTCLVLFNDRDMDSWYHANQILPVATQRFHSMTDAIVLVGLRSSQNPIPNYSTDHMLMANGETVLGISASKILAKNASGKSLNDLLQELVTNVQNLVTQVAEITVTGVLSGGAVSGVPSNASAITAIGTQLTATATDISNLLE